MIRIFSFKIRVAAVGICILVISQVANMLGHHPGVGALISAASLTLGFLGNYSWGLFCRLPVRPAWAVDLNGEWTGEIISNSDKLYSNHEANRIPVKVILSQTWLGITMKLKTEKMTSRSFGPYLEFQSETNELRISYFYETDPKAEFRQTNPPQSGCGHMTVDLAEPERMVLRYSTDRGSTGDITLSKQK